MENSIKHMEKTTESREHKNDPERIFRDIVEKRKQHEHQVVPTIEGINDLIKDFPSTVSKNLLQNAEYLKSRAVDDVAFRELFLKETKRVWSQYIVERFGMPSKLFAKEEVKHAIDGLLSNSPELEDFKKVARISIDANGLKAVNDLNRGDHSKGDIFLDIVARVIKDEQTAGGFKEQGITLIPTSDGGDEFGIVVISERPIEKHLLDEIMRRVDENLLSDEITEEVQRALDFKDESVISAFAGFTKAEWAAKSHDEKSEEIKKLSIPENFVFQARTSMGATTLYDSFSTMKGERHEIHEGDSYDRILEKLMGGVFTRSDEKMQEYKDEFKKSLRESDDPSEKFLSLVYARNDAERELSKELTETKKELGKCLEGRS